eukprot:5347849-Alexandrium_andersonii.AAC.1
MYGGIGLLSEKGRDRALRMRERHTDPQGPGGWDISEAWDSAECSHIDVASMVNAAAPVASATGAAALPVEIFTRVAMWSLRLAFREEQDSLALHVQHQRANGAAR